MRIGFASLPMRGRSSLTRIRSSEPLGYRRVRCDDAGGFRIVVGSGRPRSLSAAAETSTSRSGISSEGSRLPSSTPGRREEDVYDFLEIEHQNAASHVLGRAPARCRRNIGIFIMSVRSGTRAYPPAALRGLAHQQRNTRFYFADAGVPKTAKWLAHHVVDFDSGGNRKSRFSDPISIVRGGSRHVEDQPQLGVVTILDLQKSPRRRSSDPSVTPRAVKPSRLCR